MNKNPEVMVPYSPRPAARDLTLADLWRPLPCGSRPAIFKKACASSSGSGLTANRKNRLPPRGSILPSTASRSPRPAGCYDPHQALHPWVSRTWTVTWLEPRTRYQPEKLKQASKNKEFLTLARNEVNRIVLILSVYASIIYSPSTGLRAKMVQCLVSPYCSKSQRGLAGIRIIYEKLRNI